MSGTGAKQYASAVFFIVFLLKEIDGKIDDYRKRIICITFMTNTTWFISKSDHRKGSVTSPKLELQTIMSNIEHTDLSEIDPGFGQKRKYCRYPAKG